jgi:hypothetical protein
LQILAAMSTRGASPRFDLGRLTGLLVLVSAGKPAAPAVGRGTVDSKDKAESAGSAGVLRRLGFRLLGTVVAANDDLFAADFHLDSIVLDVPIAHRTLLGLHEEFLDSRVIESLAATFAGRSHEEMLVDALISDFQILAHFRERAASVSVGGI